MRVGRILKYVFIGIPLLVVIIVVAALAVLMTMDFNRYKPLIAEETKKATGRDLVIAGDLEVGISLTPAISVAGVTLSNAEWGTRPEMVKVERFEAQISLIPVLFGTIDVKRVVLIGADILLEVDKEGRANFVLAPPGAPEPKKPEEVPVAEEAAPAMPVIREVVVRDSVLAYTDARTGASHSVGIDTLTVSGDGAADPIELLYEGSYNKAPIELSGTLGAPADMLEGRPLPLDLALAAGGAKVTVKGKIAEPTAAKGIDLAVSVSGEELGDMSALAGTEVPKLGAYSLSAGVSGDPASAINLTGIKAALAGSDLAGDATVNVAGERPFIDARLASNMIDLTALGGAAAPPAEGVAEQPAAKADRIFPDDPLPLEGLQAVDAKLQLDAKTVIAAGAKLQDADVGLSLKGGNLTVKPLKAGIADGTIDGSVNLDARKKAAGLVVKTTMEKVDLNRLLSELQITQDVEGRANVDIDVAGRGTTVRRIMASLDGSAGLLMGKGRMKDTFLQNMLGGPGQLMNRVLDKGQRGYTVVECAVADFRIKDGIATAKALYLDIDPRGVIGSGSVNLGAETLDLLVDPRKKRSMDKPVLPMRITGTFLAPKYKIDEKVAAQKLTKALGIELPPALAGRQKQAEAPLIEGPCAPPQPEPAAAQPAQPTQPAVPALPPEEELKDQLKKGLKGLFGQ